MIYSEIIRNGNVLIMAGPSMHMINHDLEANYLQREGHDENRESERTRLEEIEVKVHPNPHYPCNNHAERNL